MKVQNAALFERIFNACIHFIRYRCNEIRYIWRMHIIALQFLMAHCFAIHDYLTFVTNFNLFLAYFAPWLKAVLPF